MNVLARKEILINKACDEKDLLYPVISNVWDANNMIVGIKIDIVELGIGKQSIYSFDVNN